jgi:hypothetical protein
MDLADLKKSLKELNSLAIQYADINTEAFKRIAAAGEIKDSTKK